MSLYHSAKHQDGFSPTDPPLQRVIEALQKDGVEFFLDPKGVPTIMVPYDGDQKVWHVNEERNRDLVVTTCYDLVQQYPESKAINVILAEMRELCRMGGKRATEKDDTAIKKPIVQGLIRELNCKEEVEIPTTALHHKLRTAQEEGRIDPRPLSRSAHVRYRTPFPPGHC